MEKKGGKGREKAPGARAVLSLLLLGEKKKKKTASV